MTHSGDSEKGTRGAERNERSVFGREKQESVVSHSSPVLKEAGIFKELSTKRRPLLCIGNLGRFLRVRLHPAKPSTYEKNRQSDF